jgi:hypothetical protein
MKSALAFIFGAVALTGCGTSAPPVQPSGDAVNYSRQVSSAQQSISQAPTWMFELPKDPNYIFESATSISTDFSMADMKARTIAFSKICHVAGGKVRSQTKLFRSDNESVSTEQSEMAIRSICPDVDMTGVQTISMKHVAEGNKIRTYILVGLPVGNSNVLKDMKDSKKRVPDAFKELDSMIEKPLGALNSSASNDAGQTLKLLDVDNNDYKRRRDETLQKPNAVVGRVTVDGQ